MDLRHTRDIAQERDLLRAAEGGRYRRLRGRRRTRSRGRLIGVVGSRGQQQRNQSERNQTKEHKADVGSSHPRLRRSHPEHADRQVVPRGEIASA